MRNKLSKFALAAGFVLALAFTLSCSSDDNDDRENYKESYKYCVFFSTEKCLDGPFTTCSQGGTLSNNCPFQQISSSSTTNNTISSSSSKQETYYMEQGAISETAYNLVKGLDMPAEDAVSYCHRYPVSHDKYAEAESGISRARLEKELEPLPNKAAVLRSLDKDGAVFGIFEANYEDLIFLYIEKEK